MNELYQKQLDKFIETASTPDIYGVYKDVPDEVYHHKTFPGMSGSKLAKVRDSIYTYVHSLTEAGKTTKALEYGRAFHSAILTPEIFKEEYVISPKFDGRTTKGKEGLKTFIEEHPGKTLINEEDYEVLKGMMNECWSNKVVSNLLSEGDRELTLVWNTNNVLSKGKLDLCRENDMLIIDIKTARSCKLRHFKKSLLDDYYAPKAAFYIDGANQLFTTKIIYFIYIVIEKEPPYNLDIFQLDNRTIMTGRKMYKEDLQTYIDYTLSNDHTIFKPKKISVIGLDDWAHREYGDKNE